MKIRKITIGSLAFGAALLGLAACTPPPAPTPGGEATTPEPIVTETVPTEAAMREPVTFTATEFKYEGPESIPGGLTELKLVNEGKQPHALVLIGITPGKTFEDLVANMKEEGPP